MIKKMRLTKDDEMWYGVGGYKAREVYKNREISICAKVLGEYFDLSDNPEIITLIISDRKIKESYFTKEASMRLIVHKSNGGISFHNIRPVARKFLAKYPEGIWAALE